MVKEARFVSARFAGKRNGWVQKSADAGVGAVLEPLAFPLAHGS